MVFTFRFDEEHKALVWLMSGPSNSDDDFARYVETILAFDRMARDFKGPCALLHVDEHNPRPSALWRKRIAEATVQLHSRPYFALSSPQAIIRGVITAINWLRPPPFEFSTHARFEDSVKWVEGRTGRNLEVCHALMMGAREDARLGIRTSPPA